MSESETPPITEEPRHTFGWWMLGLLLAVMLVNSLVTSLSPKNAAANPPINANEELLKQVVSQLRLISYSPTGDETSTKDLRTKTLEELKEPISDLVPASKTDPAAARMYAAMRTEAGESVPQESLAPLRNSKSPSDQVLARIYGVPKLSPAEAKAMVAMLPDEPFVYQLAKVHALEKSGDKEARDRIFTGRRAIGMVVAGIFAIMVLIGSAIAWSLYMRARRDNKIGESSGYPMGSITLADADRLALRAAQIVGLFLVYLVLAALLRLGAAGTIASGIAIIVTLPILAQVPVYGKRITLQTAGISARNLFQHILWGIGGFLVELPIALFMAALGAALFSFLPAPTHPAAQELAQAKDLWSKLPIILFATITAPIWEEFVFRGLLFPALGRVFGRVVAAAVATGFIFAMIHPQGIALWFGLATVGTMGCALTYHTRSLIPTMVMHMLHNTATVALLLLMTAPV
ncbi:CPBP family intramembrane glutamic endopeptidase [Fimbriimonas ginsengisoli]|uniref:CAAX amino terminal protease family membrane protein n=1 Tax=Fimbriimonas ginsengisoli Gsoil 348 TaxID=661478 RepID=A0A068NMY6_FIMGI|nr:CPBP family intramembrane glutamic endopeptidase [Fimbriimonas ginsengisoli]AIE84928.1 CAAX amino terminal protease family membrane protein [Fimbriimonas ginsengisoli Gsoil 348]